MTEFALFDGSFGDYSAPAVSPLRTKADLFNPARVAELDAVHTGFDIEACAVGYRVDGGPIDEDARLLLHDRWQFPNTRIGAEAVSIHRIKAPLDDVLAWLSGRGIAAEIGAYQVIKLDDEQEAEFRARWI